MVNILCCFVFLFLIKQPKKKKLWILKAKHLLTDLDVNYHGNGKSFKALTTNRSFCFIRISAVLPSPRTSPINSLRLMNPSLSLSYSLNTSSMAKSYGRGGKGKLLNLNMKYEGHSYNECIIISKLVLQPCDPLQMGGWRQETLSR